MKPYERSLQGKTVLITGASRGIGRAVALDLDRQGVDLLLTATSLPRLQTVADQIEALVLKTHICK